MLTARDAEVDKVVGLELGADDYVTKPFSSRELTARIRAVLRARGAGTGLAAAPADGRSGRVQVDLAGHRVLRDGEVFPVKPKVFDLLAFLLRHPGQVISRDQLLEQVWGYDYPGETRTVDVHVHWLRVGGRARPQHPSLIETVRGTGYVLRRPGRGRSVAAASASRHPAEDLPGDPGDHRRTPGSSGPRRSGCCRPRPSGRPRSGRSRRRR